MTSSMHRKPYPWYADVERFSLGNCLLLAGAVITGNLAAQWWRDSSRFSLPFTASLIGFSLLGVGIALMLRHALLLAERKRRGLAGVQSLIGVAVSCDKRRIGSDEGVLEFTDEQVHFRGSAMNFSLLSAPGITASMKDRSTVLVNANDHEWQIQIHGAGADLLEKLSRRLTESSAAAAQLPPLPRRS